MDDSKCQAAADWWVKHHAKWATVRQNWDGVFAKNKDLELAPKVKGKVLYKYLFDDKLTDGDKIKKVIEDFVVTAEME